MTAQWFTLNERTPGVDRVQTWQRMKAIFSRQFGLWLIGPENEGVKNLPFEVFLHARFNTEPYYDGNKESKSIQELYAGYTFVPARIKANQLIVTYDLLFVTDGGPKYFTKGRINLTK